MSSYRCIPLRNGGLGLGGRNLDGAQQVARAASSEPSLPNNLDESAESRSYLGLDVRSKFRLSTDADRTAIHPRRTDRLNHQIEDHITTSYATSLDLTGFLPDGPIGPLVIHTGLRPLQERSSRK
ncbi:hypothetical protein [Mycobacterium angelicum]|uniref:Uncharacterized protein n=1 Tax=Mycobacterium angelicum TaxID=470074 RepID=A0A1W9ZTL6_MYCAN|nr:hypothetical protein [Mycobacterium angelicum]MCV7200350.1 hypothetical protein [Mycobacterium angelicum]ORA20886.1 hypothetical protein BST12_14225 [Mycobacterium angelicum]